MPNATERANVLAEELRPWLTWLASIHQPMRIWVPDDVFRQLRELWFWERIERGLKRPKWIQEYEQFHHVKVYPRSART